MAHGPPPLPDTATQADSSLVALFLSFAMVTFLGSGVISFFSDALEWGFERQDLAVAAGSASLIMFLLGIVIYLLMALLPRIPKRLFLPLSLFLPVTSVGVLPLLVYYSEYAPQIFCAVSLAQVLLGTWLVRRVRRGLTAKRSIFPNSLLKPRKFSWAHLVGMLLAAAFIIIPGLLLYGAFSAKLALHHFTDQFVNVGPAGISMQVRKYQRGDGKEITLMPMSHVGEAEFYQALAESISPDAVVLMEGVSDSQKNLKAHSNYSKMAAVVGGVEQVKVFKPRGKIVAADVDVSNFSPTTRDLLKTAMMLHTKGVTPETLPILMKPAPPGLERQLIEDILTKRNHHLLKVLQERLSTSDQIVVPWGAAHMPEIAREILKLGFRQTATRDFLAIRFGS